MEKRRIWKIITICFVSISLLLTIIGLANPFKDNITFRMTRGMLPSEIGDVDLQLQGSTLSISLLDLDVGDLDQVQDHFDSYAVIGKYPGACIAQGVVNSRDSLLGVKVLMNTFGSYASSPVFLGIMTTLGSPTQTESYRKLGGLLPGIYPTDWTWLSLDFSDNPLDVAMGEQFWIVMFSLEDVEDDGFRAWGSSTQALYPSAVHAYDFNAESWVASDTIDMCFATYTPAEDDPPPPPPPPPDDVYLGEAVTCRSVSGWQDHGPTVTTFDLGERVYCYMEWQPTTHNFYGDYIGFDWYYNGEIIDTMNSEVTEQWYGVWWGRWWDNLPEGQGYVAVYWNSQYIGASNEFNVVDPDPSPPVPEVPVINITFNSWVLIIGSLNWIGAGVSFMKYRVI